MKGYALLIGVNRVLPDYYNTSLNLPCALQDVEGISQAISEISSFEQVSILINENSSWQNVKVQITDIKNKVDSSDESAYLLIYYTAHGFSYENPNNIGYTEEFFSFYEECISENKIKAVINTLSNKFKVLLIADTCHAGGLIDPALSAFDSGIQLPTPSFTPIGQTKAIPNETVEYIVNNHPVVFSTEVINWNTQAEVAILTACEKGQYTEQDIGSSKYSLFTFYLLSHLKSNLHRNSHCYTQLLQGLRSPDTKPNIFFINESDFFKTKSFLSMTTEATCNCKEESFLKECDLKAVNVIPHADLGMLKNCNGSFTLNLKTTPTTDPLYIIIETLIKKIDPNFPYQGVDTLSVVFMNQFGFGTALPTEIYGMKSEDACIPDENGYVAIFESHGGWKCIKGKRTKGKVSNKLG